MERYHSEADDREASESDRWGMSQLVQSVEAEGQENCVKESDEDIGDAQTVEPWSTPVVSAAAIRLDGHGEAMSSGLRDLDARIAGAALVVAAGKLEPRAGGYARPKSQRVMEAKENETKAQGRLQNRYQWTGTGQTGLQCTETCTRRTVGDIVPELHSTRLRNESCNQRDRSDLVPAVERLYDSALYSTLYDLRSKDGGGGPSPHRAASSRLDGALYEGKSNGEHGAAYGGIT